MVGRKKHRTTSELLERVVEKHTEDMMSFLDIRDSLKERGFGVLLALAALPLCIPVPVPPGYTTFFAVPLFILCVQMIYGKKTPWIPGWLGRRQIKRKTLSSLVEKAAPLLRKIEKLVSPRMEYISTHAWEKAIGVFSFIFTVSIAIPLPLTNLPPGYGILIMSLGLLGRDGFTIVAGMVVGTIGVFITAGIVIASWGYILSWFQ